MMPPTVKYGICDTGEPGSHRKSTKAPNTIASHARKRSAKSTMHTAGTHGEMNNPPMKPSAATPIRTLFSNVFDIDELKRGEIFGKVHVDLLECIRGIGNHFAEYADGHAAMRWRAGIFPFFENSFARRLAARVAAAITLKCHGGIAHHHFYFLR